MKKTLIAAMALIATVCNANAQNFSAADQAKMNSNNLVPGKVINQKGDTLIGFLMKSKDSNFADFAVKIKFISAADFSANEKFSNKLITSYTAKDIKGYVYDYAGTKRNFRSAKIKSTNLQGFVEMGKTLPNGESLCSIYTDPASKTYPATQTHQGVLTTKGEALMVTEQNPAEFYKTRCPEVAKKWKENYYNNKSVGKTVTYDKTRMEAFNDYLKTCGSEQK